jgi:hypothetical protein
VVGRLRQLGEKLRQVSFQSNEKDLLLIVEAHEATAVDLNILQMDDGRTALDQRIKPEYAPITIEFKQLKGQPFNKVTLEDEGNFKRGMFMNAERWPIMFSSTDFKVDLITTKYGEDVFGLTKKSISSLGVEIKPEVVKHYEDLFSV